jgi:hypothetical protein
MLVMTILIRPMARFNPERPFGGVLGSTAELRVLDLLLSVPRHGYNISELARASGLARATCDRVVKHLVEWQLLRMLESHGNIDSYWLNEDSDHISALRDFHLTTLFGEQPTEAHSLKMSQAAHQTFVNLGFTPSSIMESVSNTDCVLSVSTLASARLTSNSSLSPRTGITARATVGEGMTIAAI